MCIEKSYTNKNGGGGGGIVNIIVFFFEFLSKSMLSASLLKFSFNIEHFHFCLFVSCSP